jgi:hypothetical protein
MACSGNDLLVAGRVWDDTIVTPVAALGNGDAAQVLLDGRGDGIVRPGQDDLDLIVGADGRAEAYGRPVPGATVAAAVTTGSGSNWRFELRLPLASIWEGLTKISPATLGRLFGLFDNDGGDPGPDQVLSGQQGALVLPTAAP